jgi:hypothetical protein
MYDMHDDNSMGDDEEGQYNELKYSKNGWLTKYEHI